MSKCIEGEVKATEPREKVYEPHVKVVDVVNKSSASLTQTPVRCKLPLIATSQSWEAWLHRLEYPIGRRGR
jgi:hypothetical protein